MIVLIDVKVLFIWLGFFCDGDHEEFLFFKKFFT